MKRVLSRILLIVATMLLPTTVASAQSAQETFRKASSKITGASGVTFSFSISGESNVSGSFKACGKKFTMTTKEGTVWYNGTYMWSYNAKAKETTRVRPSAEELAETNPILFIAQNQAGFKAEMGKSSSASQKVLILTPKTKNSVERAVLTLNAKTLAPEKLAIRINGKTTVVKVSKFALGGKFAASTFEYPASKYPNVTVTNL